MQRAGVKGGMCIFVLSYGVFAIWDFNVAQHSRQYGVREDQIARLLPKDLPWPNNANLCEPPD